MKNQSNQTTPISEPKKDGFSQFSQVLEDCRRTKEQKIDEPDRIIAMPEPAMKILKIHETEEKKG